VGFVQETSKSQPRVAEPAHNGEVKILLVEDDRSIASSLVDGLGAAGHTVTHVITGAEALQARGYEMVLLDLGLPDMDGRDVCRQLRASTAVPIIMLTARSEEFDRVLGLELGADDYVTKPFSLRELVARIRAVARRTGTAAADGGADDNAGREGAGRQAIGPLSIDRRTRRVHLGDAEVQLTAKEFDLLAFLATDPGAVRTRTEILENVWDEHWYGPTKTVDAHVASIRKKLGSNGWIEAVRGVGFRLEPPA
jgi:DNA-binding response OmpR family regulator